MLKLQIFLPKIVVSTDLLNTQYKAVAGYPLIRMENTLNKKVKTKTAELINLFFF